MGLLSKKPKCLSKCFIGVTVHRYSATFQAQRVQLLSDLANVAAHLILATDVS